MTLDRRTRYDVDRAGLATLLADQPSYRIDQIWRGLYEDRIAPDEITTLPKALRSRLAEDLPAALEPVTESVSDDGQTVKWLWQLDDGARVETVLMHYHDRSTVCVSTQAGCAMACGFCATGQGGFERNLSCGEIVEQVVRASQRAAQGSAPRRVSNVVFMGMGEPMANYDRTLDAAHRMQADLGISARHLTISTVGIVPGIRRLAEEPLPVNLAVSLVRANRGTEIDAACGQLRATHTGPTVTEVPARIERKRVSPDPTD
jgi:23S rRNA (adenine2503-C2)-methyltransferase